MPKLANTKIYLIIIIINIISSCFVNFNLAYAKQKQVDPTMPRNIENSLINGVGNNNRTSSKHLDHGGALVVTAILTNAGNNSAVINDQIVHEKDQIAKYEVIKIENNKVILKKIINENPEFEQNPQEQQEQIIEIKVPAINIKE